jgi:hypothetical protein
MLSVVADESARPELRADLDELAREGARRMLAVALEAEVDDYLAAHAAERDERGRRLVVRNGHARQREVTTSVHANSAREALVKLTTLPLLAGENVFHRGRPSPSGPVRNPQFNRGIGRGRRPLQRPMSGPVRDSP